MDIQNIRETDTDLREANCKGFEVGNIISITEKFDGSNLCIVWDSERGEVAAFSRNKELSLLDDMRGAYSYALLSLNKKAFSDNPTYYFFGEWAVKNKIQYDPENMKKWRVFDIYDSATQTWLAPDSVKDICKQYDLEYMHELFYGEFISWEHVKGFMNMPAYGSVQEGVVVRNITKLNSDDKYNPWIIKLVNLAFKESMKTKEKIVDPDQEKAKEEARALVESIVTRNRVEKEIYKMINEGLLPEKLDRSNMREISKMIPKRINDDCLKEESEIVAQCGEFWGKLCAYTSMMHVRTIVLGECY